MVALLHFEVRDAPVAFSTAATLKEGEEGKRMDHDPLENPDYLGQTDFDDSDKKDPVGSNLVDISDETRNAHRVFNHMQRETQSWYPIPNDMAT